MTKIHKQGIPCRYGHIKGRYISNNICVECHEMRSNAKTATYSAFLIRSHIDDRRAITAFADGLLAIRQTNEEKNKPAKTMRACIFELFKTKWAVSIAEMRQAVAPRSPGSLAVFISRSVKSGVFMKIDQGVYILTSPGPGYAALPALPIQKRDDPRSN